MADIQELYARRLEAASIALARGDRSEAERLFSEALTMGEENFGAGSPELAVPLNELSRLYVHLSAHARAEPLLERLLKIRRAGGEDHPGVATVLSALAAVRRGLKDDAGAEELYRRALAIRESAHAPEHMSVIVAVEQLADTCAARGKVAEARALYERALPVREKALGAEHATVSALRSRMAELAAKASPSVREAPAPAGAAAVAAPAPAPVVADAPPSNQLVFIYEPEKPVRRPSVKRERNVTPPFSSMAVAAASMIVAPTHVAAAQPPAPMEVAAPQLAITSIMDFDTQPVVPRAESERAAHDGVIQPWQRRESAARAQVFAEPPRNHVKRYAYAAVGMTALAGALFVANAKLSGDAPPEPVAVADAPPPVAPPAALPAATVSGAAALGAVSRPDPARIASAEPVKVAAPTTARPAADAERKVAAPTLPGALPTIGDVAVPVVAVANADSVIRASTKGRDSYADQLLPSAGRLKSPALADSRAETVPVLIGSVPQPRFPDALRSQRIEGAVVVQFLVGADGQVDASSMKVVRSPHDQFTAAVRAVLPRFRFEPARGADGKSRAEWVQYSIEFSATR